MMAELVPRNSEVSFDFTPIAGKSKAMEWGAVSQKFNASPGTVVMTAVASLPLGATLAERGGGSRIVVEEIKPGMGAEAAGMRVGDVLTAVTAIKIPKAANLVKEPIGAVYLCDERNPNLFNEVMDALVSNSEANGGYGKTILVFERDAKGALDEKDDSGAEEEDVMPAPVASVAEEPTAKGKAEVAEEKVPVQENVVAGSEFAA